jgi:hypothetical protein
MLKKQISILLAAFLLFLSLLSGCTFLSFFDSTEFTIYSSEIIDDLGFAALSLTVNASDKVTVRLLSPLNRIIYSEEIFKGYQKLDIILDQYWTSPAGGSFLCNVRDSNGKKIFENEFFFSQANLSVLSVDQHWWNADDSNSLVGLSLTVYNAGDLPAYPSSIVGTVDGKQMISEVLPQVILPFESKTIHGIFYFDDVMLNLEDIVISVLDDDENVLGHISDAITLNSEISDITYTWRFKGKTYTVILPDISFLYNYYKNLDRVFIEDYALYAFSGFDTQYLSLCADRLISLTENTNDVEIINFFASFVQQLEYAPDDVDDPSFEYPRYPVETIKDGHGDCEDMALLTTSFLSILGYDVALIRVPQHMAAGVRIDEQLPSYDYFDDGYYFLETTRPGWQLGRIPDEYKGIDNFTLFPLYDRPILYHSWKNATRLTSTDSTDVVKISLVVENLGSSAARDFRISAFFITNESIILNKESVVVPFLEGSKKIIVDISIDVPQSMPSNLKTVVYLDGIQVHERVSLSVFP